MVSELHRRAVCASRDWEIAGVYDVDRKRSAQRAKEWSVPAHESLDELLALSVDAVAVLTPADTHRAVALAALEAGCHVLVEKPVAMTSSDVSDIAECATRCGLLAMPGHNYAYVPEVSRLIRLARRGDLGTIRAAFVTYAIAHSEDVARAYPGVLASIMVHNSYLALAAVGHPHRITAGVSKPAWERHPAEDQAWMTWEYDSGASAHLFASFAVGDNSADPWSFVVKVLGDRGSASATFRSSIFDRALGSLSIALPAYEESYEHELTAFADAIRGGRPPLSPITDAVAVARLIEAGYKSAASGTRIVVTVDE